MYKIERTNFGVKLVFGGFIKKEEMRDWVQDSEKIVGTLPSKFGVFVDMRELNPLPKESEEEMLDGQKLYKAMGMTRSVVILINRVTTMQFHKIAKEAGIYEWERYIDASATPEWEDIGRKWVVEGIDPDR